MKKKIGQALLIIAFHIVTTGLLIFGFYKTQFIRKEEHK